MKTGSTTTGRSSGRRNKESNKSGARFLNTQNARLDVYSTGGDSSKEGWQCQNCARCQIVFNALLKNKYQMPSSDSLIENVAIIVNDKQDEEVFFTSLDILK